MGRVEVARAARNNARWCHSVCAAHGIEGRFDDDAWTSARRTPPLYPDAVTLAPDADRDAVLARVDRSAGCSVKDSFATLDLRSHGFHVLFEARWIQRTNRRAEPGTTASRPRWRAVTVEDLHAWAQAWAADEGSTGLLRTELLADEVVVLGGFVGREVVAGAVVNRAEGVLGLTNVFGPPGRLDDTWRGCVDALDTSSPGETTVGYESGDSLASAQRWGFEAIGSMRVWHRGPG